MLDRAGSRRQLGPVVLCGDDACGSQDQNIVGSKAVVLVLVVVWFLAG
jgi:hypothetical protein